MHVQHLIWTSKVRWSWLPKSEPNNTWCRGQNHTAGLGGLLIRHWSGFCTVHSWPGITSLWPRIQWQLHVPVWYRHSTISRLQYRNRHSNVNFISGAVTGTLATGTAFYTCLTQKLLDHFLLQNDQKTFLLLLTDFNYQVHVIAHIALRIA